MGRDAPRPWFESTVRIEARVGLMHPPEGLNGHIFGCGRLTHNAQDPALNSTLMHAEQCLEGVDIAVPEPREDAVGIVPHFELSFLSTVCVMRRGKVTPAELMSGEKRFSRGISAMYST